MAGTSDSCSVDIGVDPDGDAIVAYADSRLDTATSLVLSSSDGSLTALLGRDASAKRIACGFASTKMTKALSRVESVIWARLEGQETILVSEIGLSHA